MPVGSGTSKRVRLTHRVISALEDLPTRVAGSVAQAIQRIGKEEGEPFESSDGSAGDRHMVMVPDDDQAPVVVYRQDEDGYLVTGLTKRADYRTYTHVEPSAAFLDSPAGQAALLAGGALLILYLLNRKGDSSAGAGTAA
jgi:hypothetical protein